MTDTIFKPGEYVTRDGLNAWVWRDDGGADGALIGCYADPDHGLTARQWHRNGSFVWGRQHVADLMPPKQVRYVNVYEPYDVAGAWATRKMADKAAGKDRIACIRIEFEEGQYDD